MHWPYPVHDEDPVDVEPLLQQSSGDGHRVEVAETPGAAASHRETKKINNGGPELWVRSSAKRRLGAYMGVLSSAWCPGGRTTAKPFCRDAKCGLSHRASRTM